MLGGLRIQSLIASASMSMSTRLNYLKNVNNSKNMLTELLVVLNPDDGKVKLNNHRKTESVVAAAAE